MSWLGKTTAKGSRKYLAAVVLGAYTDGKLRHYGFAGSGFRESILDGASNLRTYFIVLAPVFDYLAPAPPIISPFTYPSLPSFVYFGLFLCGGA
ncbi:MAG TPA: hypothetical protein VF020_11940 [Chthoniobacterales bacterium]